MTYGVRFDIATEISVIKEIPGSLLAISQNGNLEFFVQRSISPTAAKFEWRRDVKYVRPEHRSILRRFVLMMCLLNQIKRNPLSA